MVALLGDNDVQIIAADDVFTDNGGNDAVSRLAHNDFFFGLKNFAVSRCCQPFAVLYPTVFVLQVFIAVN